MNTSETNRVSTPIYISQNQQTTDTGRRTRRNLAGKGAVGLATLLMALSGTSMASALTPPPDGPPTVGPPTGVIAPAPAAPTDLPVSEAPPATTPAAVPTTTPAPIPTHAADPPVLAQSPAGSVPASPAAPSPVRSTNGSPRAKVELTSRTATVQRDGVTVSLRCEKSGQLTLVARGKQLGSAKFVCRDHMALAKVKLSSRQARSVASHSSERVTAVFSKLGTGNQTMRLSLTLAVAGSSSHMASGSLWTDGNLECGSEGTSDAGALAINAPMMATATPEWVTYRPYIYVYGIGWENTSNIGWAAWQESGPNNWVDPGTVTMGRVTPGRDLYAAGAVEIAIWNGREVSTEWNWVHSQADYLGYSTYGEYYCEIP
jgi:hypothetical protein